MGVVEELIRKDADGTLSFGNYLLDTKTKNRILHSRVQPTKSRLLRKLPNWRRMVR